MKIWSNYGSEHSANLVMIGHFKTIKDAKEANHMINTLRDKLEGLINPDDIIVKYDKKVRDLLDELHCYMLMPNELQQFLYSTYPELKGDIIEIKTDEDDVSAFMKIMINKGAKLEIYSAHDYPSED